MYRLGEVEHSHRRFYAGLLGFILLLALGGVVAFYFLQPNTDLGTPPPTVTTHVSYDTTKLTTFNEPLFTMDLPDGWKPTTHSTDIPRPAYTWQGTVKDDTARWMSVYVDQDVSKLAVNRELAVQANGKSVNVLSDVSDNCTTFTGASSQNYGSTPAKWQGFDFLCDSGNYMRDVVGISSSDGMNVVALTGTSGSHHLFFTYTDNSPSADYSIFINAIRSFHLK